MRLGLQYNVSPSTIRALTVLGEHPMIREYHFIELMWPGALAAGKWTASALYKLQQRGLVSIHWSPSLRLDRPYLLDRPPRKLWRLTDGGYAIYDYFRGLKATGVVVPSYHRRAHDAANRIKDRRRAYLRARSARQLADAG